MELDPRTLDAATARCCELSLIDFVEEMWPAIESQPFVRNWHHEVICDHLQAVSRGELENVLINIPPGCTKSLLVAVMWPCWEWVSDASVRWFFASYHQHLASRDSTKSRALVNSAKYQRFWGDRYHWVGDQNQKTYFENSAGGYRLATSIGGHATGEHMDRIVVDDPHDVESAESDKQRQRVIEWWDQTMSTRGVARGVRRVVVMQRLHEKDLSGHIMGSSEADDWVHVMLPMRYEKERHFVSRLGHEDPRKGRKQELMFPELFDEKTVKSLERKLGIYGTAGQLQQRPAPLGGGIFKKHWFDIVQAAPSDARRIRYWDKACLLPYWTGVATRGGRVTIEAVRPGMEVLTRCGWRRVVRAGLTKFATSVAAVVFADGSVLHGTPDHLVWTTERGWVELADLRASDACLGDQSIQTACSSRGGATSENRADAITTATSGTASGSGTSIAACIETFGQPNTGRFPQVLIFTTLTATGLTTRRKILSASQRLTTRASTTLRTAVRQQELVCGRWAIRTNGCCERVQDAAGRSVRGPAMSDTALFSADMPDRWSSGAASSAELFSRLLRANVCTVASDVGGELSVRGVPVFDLQIEGEPEFFANGTLVHNSTEAGGAYTSGMLMAEKGGLYYIEGVERAQLDPFNRNRLIKQTAMIDAARHSGRVMIVLEGEPGAGGKESSLISVRELAGYPVMIDKVQLGKLERAMAFAGQCGAGNVKVVARDPNAQWVRDLLDEFEQFPNGEYKDQVDTATGAFNKLALGVGAMGGDLFGDEGELTEEEEKDMPAFLRELVDGVEDRHPDEIDFGRGGYNPKDLAE